MTRWPRCIVTLRDGSKQEGDVAHIADKITVRLDVEPWETEGQFGKQIINFTYKDFDPKYVELI